MNCLFWLVLLFCCGNHNRSQYDYGSSCPVEGSSDYGCARNNQNNSYDRSGGNCQDNDNYERSGRSCQNNDSYDRSGRSYQNSDSYDRSNRSCDEKMRSGSMSRYDDSRRGYENADTVPGMNRSVMNGYAAYQDGCSCND